MKGFFSILFIVLFLGFIPISCKENAGGCDDTNYPKSFTMKSMQIQSVVLKDFAPLDTGLFYPAKDIAKRLFTNDATFFTERRVGFSFVNEALACSPVEPQATHHISKVEIINQTDSLVIDSQLMQKGTDLSSYFSMKVNNREAFLPIADFLTLEYKIRYDNSYLLQFAKTLNTQTKLQFDLTITMNDGARFTFKNEYLKVR